MVQHNPIYLQLLTTINSSWHIRNHFSLSHRPCGCLVCRSDALGAVQIYCCGFVICNGVWWYVWSDGVKILILAWNLCLICYYTHIGSLIIANEKACSTSLLGGWSKTGSQTQHFFFFLYCLLAVQCYPVTCI